jgi:predicted mannosyl-3-phosphoglycerate phosphatase (HAD superfamily)
MVKQKVLRLDGFTQAERIQMTAQVSDGISEAGACITDLHQYSNTLIAISFKVLLANLDRLTTALQDTGLHLTQESLDQLMYVNDSKLKDEECLGTLQITFVHN